MPHWFIRFSEFTKFSGFLLHLGKTPMASNLTTQRFYLSATLVPHRLQCYSKLFTKVCIAWNLSPKTTHHWRIHGGSNFDHFLTVFLWDWRTQMGNPGSFTAKVSVFYQWRKYLAPWMLPFCFSVSRCRVWGLVEFHASDQGLGGAYPTEVNKFHLWSAELLFKFKSSIMSLQY